MAWLFMRSLCCCLYQGGKDSCRGDSGGPLVAVDPVDADAFREPFSLLGVVNRGLDGRATCGRPGIPGVYADLPFFLQTGWLNETLAGMRACRPPFTRTKTTEISTTEADGFDINIITLTTLSSPSSAETATTASVLTTATTTRKGGAATTTRSLDDESDEDDYDQELIVVYYPDEIHYPDSFDMHYQESDDDYEQGPNNEIIVQDPNNVIFVSAQNIFVEDPYQLYG